MKAHSTKNESELTTKTARQGTYDRAVELTREPLGASRTADGAHFCIWAPKAKSMDLVVQSKSHAMTRDERGYYRLDVKGVRAGDLYSFKIDGQTTVPDPASRYQPEGPHGPSQVVSHDYAWRDVNWKGLPMNQFVIYELHVGTFTDAGTFEAVIEKLPHLKEMGVTAIEIMPVAQFAGKRNWGYDGVGLFATHNTYGTPEQIAPLALKRLVDECHAHGIAALLDVVYNHLGPEGNYLPQLGPYFQSKYKTPWGDALNYDGDWADEVRRYFLSNARQWLEEFHFDGLRLDAVHAIFDTSARPFLEDLSRMKTHLEETLNRPLVLIAESDANDSRILRKFNEGGLGMDGQWADDLHHTIHALLTGENQSYYADYGKIEQFVAAYKEGVIFNGEYSEFRHRSFGRSYANVDQTRLVVCSQNHDQIGNRMKGDRLISLVGPEKARLAAACVFLTENLPLIFQGEEFAESRPFMYFVDHTDKELLKAVSKGRKEEFASFQKEGEEAPDPAHLETFEGSKLDWKRASSDQRALSFKSYYKKLIDLSKWIRREKLLDKRSVEVELLGEGRVVRVIGRQGSSVIEAFLSFSAKVEKVQHGVSAEGLEIAVNSAENESFPASEGSKSKADQQIALEPYSALVFVKRPS